MINLCIINGSPKIKNSNTDFFIQELCSDFNSDIKIEKYYVKQILKDTSLFNKIIASDKILIASPLYADSFPSITLEFLSQFEEFLKDKNSSRIEVYGMVNCGFFEGEQNQIALTILNHFCKKVNLTWRFGIGIGGGEFFPNSSKAPKTAPTNNSLYEAIFTLKNDIEKTDYKVSNNILIKPNKMSQFFYRFACNIGWYFMSMKKYNIKIPRLHKKIY